MRSLIIILLTFVSVALFSGSHAAAAPDIGVGAGSMSSDIATKSGYSPNVTEYTLSETIGKYIRAGLTLIGTIFFVLTIYAGVLWMTAQGNGEQVEKATGILRTGIIGLIIVFSAYGITWLVLLTTTLSNTSTNTDASTAAKILDGI